MSEREPLLRSEHAVVFYEDQTELLKAVAIFVDEDAPSAMVLFLATPAHAPILRRRWPEARYVSAEAMLQSFSADGLIDSEAFVRNVGGLLRLAATEGRPLRVVSETGAALWEQRLVSQAIELEALWAGLAETMPFALLSAYPSTLVLDSDHPHAVNEVCSLPTRVLPTRPADAVAVRAFPPISSSVRGARQFVADFLGDAGNQGDRLLLIVSELATNAVRHAGSPFVVEAVRKAGTVSVSVRDRSKTQVGVNAAPMDDECGRGLGVVDTLSDEWGVRFTAQGKVVWASVEADPLAQR